MLRIDIRDIFVGVFAVCFLVIFVSVFTYIYFAKDLTSPENIMNSNNTGLILLDRNGTPFFTFYQAKIANYVSLPQVSPVAQEAVVTEEDKNFYTEGGFSIPAIVGAAIADFKAKSPSYGGSTITQQLVKNSLLNSNKSFLRKYQEIILSQELARRYSKDQILEMYLNSVYFGNGAFGIQQAARYYFGEDAKNLDIAQSALLAGILPAPSQLSPVGGDLTRARLRQRFVLNKMEKNGQITPFQEQQALSEILNFSSGTDGMNSQAPHFALMVRDQLIAQYGEEAVARSGFRVRTTLDLSMQQYAQQAVVRQVQNLEGNNVSNGAAVAMDPRTGEILVMVGSMSWNAPNFGKVNMATTPRQTGSSFKPIVYSAAFEGRLITTSTVLLDVPTTFNNCAGQVYQNNPSCTYAPQDYDNHFWGPVTVRRALSNSRNVPAVEVMQKVGVQNALEMAGRLGVTTLGDDPTQYGLSLVLGTGQVKLVDLTSVYAVFANGGVRNPPVSILQIQDKYGNNTYSYTPTPKPVLDPGVAFLITSILSDSVSRAEEFGNLLSINRVAAVKTGTTSDFKDSWTLGYTPSLVVGAWVGNNDDQAMDNVAGSLGAAPIWRNLMEHYLAGTPQESFHAPPDVVAGGLCGVSLAVAKRPSYQEYYLVGTMPENCNSTATSSASLISSNFDFTDNGQPTVDCVGPDKKHVKLTSQGCSEFNKAWSR